MSDRSTNNHRRKTFKWLALAVGILPLALLEIGLRIFDPSQAPDPYAGFGGKVPVFEQAGTVCRTVKAREPFLAQQEFSSAKPANGCRIFCFGGSTVFGRPFHSETAFPRWLELQLTVTDPERDYEVVNCGGISYASYRIVPMVRECLQYQPDAIILATGHNEFLEDRTYSSVKERGALRTALDSLRLVTLGRELLQSRAPVAAEENHANLITRLDAESGYASYRRDPEWRERVLAQFRDSIQQIVADCQAANTPLTIVRLGSNLRDCPPFKSEHRADLTPDEEADWQRKFEAAETAEKSDLEAALKSYQAALAIDDRFALLHYRIARLHDRAGRAPDASRHYLAAMEEDICPLRMFESQREFLGTLASQHSEGLTVVDVEDFDGQQNVPGYERYLDHVHPTIAGHQNISNLLLASLRQSLNIPAHQKPAERTGVFARHFSDLRANYLADGERRLDWLEDWARREKLSTELIPQSAHDHFRLGVKRLDFGAMREAQHAFTSALELDLEISEEISQHARQLANDGRTNAASELLTWLNTRAAQ
ncbi:MAG: tetratricopeptide (TPR) repeat protein [Limisphaerales bacterium]|jgi:tetratricopeptide (TPR) repeat protein